MSGQSEQRRGTSTSPSLGDGVVAGVLCGAMGAAGTWALGGNALASVLVAVATGALLVTLSLLTSRQLWVEGDSVREKWRQGLQSIAISDIQLIYVDYLPRVGWRLNIEGANGEAICNVAIDRGTQEFRRELARRLDEVENTKVLADERAAQALKN